MPIRSFRPSVESCENRSLMSVTPAFGALARIKPAPIVAAAPKIPLDEMKTPYLGEVGGLYGDWRNAPSDALAKAAAEAVARIVPLNSAGAPSNRGKIGFLAIGHSTTKSIFDTFRTASRSVKAAPVTLVNGGRDGMVSVNWATQQAPWKHALSQVRAAGLDAKQIQAIWIETAFIFPASYGSYAQRKSAFVGHLNAIVNRAASTFPNLQVMYFSSRYYAGYTRFPIDPEPYAYESAFGVRELILSRINEHTTSPDQAVRKPVVMWGPYYWTDGMTASKIDGLSWNVRDFQGDGIHPSTSGRAKGADQLLRFFTQDALARRWFTGKG